MKKKTIITISSIAVIVILAITIGKNASGGAKPITVSCFNLEKGELVDSISAKGIVESENAKNVYSNLTHKIKTVNVEEGDRVSAGDVLCVLDTEDLEFQIAQKKADLNATQKANLNKIQNNKRILNEASSNLSNGENSQILNAESSLNTAKITLDTAQKNYDDKVKELNDGTNAQIVNAQNSLKSAQLDYDSKKKTHDDNAILYNEGIIAYEQFRQSETALEAAQNTLDSSKSSLENAERALDTEITALKNSLDTAQVTYNNAVSLEKSSKILANQEIKNHQNNVESAELSSNTDSQLISIQTLEKQLTDSIIKSPISGTVTAVYAKEGAAGSGLLFVVEDTDNLKIETKIKEYDSGKIAPDLDVEIKSDVTGEEVYEGKIDKIAATSVKGANGEAISTTDVEFKTDVSVLSQNTGLKIGMNTRLTIIIDKLDDAFYVPYDSVSTNSQEQNVIYTIKPGEKPKTFQVVEIPVELGMETDFYVQVSGEGLEEGMQVINDASSVTNKQEVVLEEAFEEIDDSADKTEEEKSGSESEIESENTEATN